MSTTNQYLDGLQQMRYDLFKSQDPEIGQYDVIFEIDGKLLYVHKIMLTLISTTFASMLSNRWIKNDEVIKISDYGYDDFFQFITFIYSGQCALTNSNIFAMIDMAEFYGIPQFKAYCQLYVYKMEITVENVFKLLDIATKFSFIRCEVAAMVFIERNFEVLGDSDEFMKLNKNVVKNMVLDIKNYISPEIIFKVVYKWTEKHAMRIQASSMNLNDIIKAEISEFLPHIYFHVMPYDFLLQFVVSRGFIFSSLNELSKILCDRYLQPKVNILDSRGRIILSGNVITEKNIFWQIKTLKSVDALANDDNMGCFWKRKSRRPFFPSPVKKRVEIEWYLVYSPKKDIAVQHCSKITERYYILAELNPGTTKLQIGNGCKIEIE